MCDLSKLTQIQTIGTSKALVIKAKIKETPRKKDYSFGIFHTVNVPVKGV